MAKMKWTKPSAETIAYFERIAPGPPIEARRMFGMPARFLNGHMLVAVFGDTFMLHLSEVDRDACIRAGAKPFAPLGREAKEYVDIAPGTFDDRTLKQWIVRGMRYLGSLPPKLKKQRAKAAMERRPQRGSAPPSRAPLSAAPGSKGRGKAATKRSRSAPLAGTAAKAKTRGATGATPSAAASTSTARAGRKKSGAERSGVSAPVRRGFARSGTAKNPRAGRKTRRGT
jgi:TfoX/Sxy family transcriptional regulator of competence genes